MADLLLQRGVDFAIITAKPVERDAVLRRLEDCVRVDQPADPYVYYRGKITIPGVEDAYQVVLAMLLDQGNLEAAAETTELIHRWHPSCVLMVGIAGGIADKGVAKGDVVVAKYVHYYEHGKLVPGGEQRRPRQYRPNRVLWAKAWQYVATEWTGDVRVQPPGGNEGHLPHEHFEPIGAGEKVIADLTPLKRLRKECPELVAVAMEAAGVAQAVENGGSSFLEIRGISDLADRAKTDDWQEYAADAAAAFTFGFLRTKPVYTMQELKRARNGDRALPAVPVVILRAQSLRQIRSDELLSALPEEMRGRDHETVSLDFCDLVEAVDRKLANPEAAVRRLTDPQGGLLTVLGRRGQVEFIFHGLVHIPLAVMAGYLISDRQAVRFFDFQPSPGSETWAWPDTGVNFPSFTVTGMPDRPQRRSGDVALRISVSYAITSAQTRVVVPNPTLDIGLDVPKPERSLVRSEAQTRAYGQVFRQVLDALAPLTGRIRRIHLFYAGPVSLAFHLGQQISENIHPPVVVWNYARAYDWGIDLGVADEKFIVYLKRENPS